ncbi:MAG: N-glycosylase/DNA lyase [Candidatus Aenigmatarchaeota archaeon]|nr:N-glycosylase/DNA lyase [Nanoarchaeota archaeon]
MKDLLEMYERFKPEIEKRRQEFRQVWQRGELFDELCFCLFTPQSKAEACWQAVLDLKSNKLLREGGPDQMKRHLQSVRFYKTKSKRLVEARKIDDVRKSIQGMDEMKAREWLVQNVNGFGYKEASHFLRNIGFSENLMILDRHILRNLVKYKVIKEIPKSMTNKKYLEIEDRMKGFADRLGIPAVEFDMLLWAKETGKVFK